MNSDEIDELIAAARAGHCGENQRCNTRPTCGCAAIDDLTDALRQLEAERQQLLADHQRLVAENEALKMDAERLDWLEQNPHKNPVKVLCGRDCGWGTPDLGTFNTPREAIDAALQQEQERNDG